VRENKFSTYQDEILLLPFHFKPKKEKKENGNFLVGDVLE